MKLSDWDSDPVFGSRSRIDPGQYLVHYTSVERLAAIALTSSIALAPLAFMNDPRESHHRQLVSVRSWWPGRSPLTEADRAAFEQVLSARRDCVRLACFTEDRVEGAPGTALREDRRGYAHSRMWAQYAAGHTGVCLILDRPALVAVAESLFGTSLLHGPVDYVSGFDERLNSAELADHDEPDPLSLHLDAVLPGLLVKNADWSSECEFRLIVDDWGAGPCAVPLDGLLQGLAIGASFAHRHLPILEAVASKHAITARIAQMVLNCGVLQPWPSLGSAGNLNVWTDADTRSDRIFDAE